MKYLERYETLGNEVSSTYECPLKRSVLIELDGDVGKRKTHWDCAGTELTLREGKAVRRAPDRSSGLH